MPNIKRYEQQFLDALKDIFKCPKCKEGYMVVRRDKTQKAFYGCTNYSDVAGGCNNTIPIADESKKVHP
jgi:ssDNA-binding Zn-finger/Zn-ribbon topoisomerase 1